MKVLSKEEEHAFWDYQKIRHFTCYQCDALLAVEPEEKRLIRCGSQREPDCWVKCPVCGGYAYEV